MKTQQKIHLAKIFLTFIIGFVMAPIPGQAQNESFSIKPAGHFGGNTTCGAVKGNYAYIGQGTYLTVLDITSEPLQQATCLELPDTAYDLFVLGNYCYLYLHNNGGLQIEDISNPLDPSITGSLPMPENQTSGGIFVSGSTAYIAAGGGCLQVVDVFNPAAPLLTGSNDVKLIDVFISGDYAYGVGDNQFRIFDITVPNPIEVGAGRCAWHNKSVGEGQPGLCNSQLYG